MKFIIATAMLCLCFSAMMAQSVSKFNDTTLLKPVEVDAIRAADKMPVAKTTLTRAQIEKNNIGQDLPFILQQTPSVIANSDAGNGIGYTGIRIRGTDAARINITLNGIPYNDAESQGTFLVNIPDFSASAGSIQIQRGVGTSTNGAGAFGGSINVSTNDLVTKRSLQFISNAGSFNSFRNTAIFNSGIFARHFTTDLRVSNISSDGYIDRASSKLKSFYGSGAYVDEKNSLRINIFTGKERTYQAWYGVREDKLANDRRHNPSGSEKTGEPYENEVDNYDQTHYQLFYNRKINTYWKGNIAFFLTTGKGYYEQYKADAALSNYGLPEVVTGTDTVSSTNLVRRLWLDNKFYGSIFSLQYDKNKTNLIFGGSINRYNGKHFGEIVSAEVQQAIPAGYRWYDLNANKTDVSFYGKWIQNISDKFSTFLDVQARSVQYNLLGFRNNPGITVNSNYFFVNPKAGITYSHNNYTAFVSYSRAGKEPNRDDFETGLTQKPDAEKLNDFELGFERKTKKSSFGINFYYMIYKDQLVLTGRVNDVGAYTRTNIDNSFRRGIELQGNTKINSWLNLNGNLTLSQNQIRDFEEYLDDYDNGGQKVNKYRTTDIALSPAVISSATINILPFKNAEINLVSKYVSRQYLDNTSMRSRSLNGYFLQDVRLNYLLQLKKAGTVNFFLQANNIFATKYEPNGYSFSYIYEGKVNTENYYLPMAQFNIMAGIHIRL